MKEELFINQSIYRDRFGRLFPITGYLDKDGLSTLVRDEAYSAVVEDDKGYVILSMKDFGYGPESR